MVGFNTDKVEGGASTNVERCTKEKVVKYVVFHFDTEVDCIIFAATVPVLLPVRTACGSFFLRTFITNITLPASNTKLLVGFLFK